MFILAIFGSLITLGAAAATAAAGGVTWAWQSSAQVKARRRAKRALKPLDKEVRQYEKALAKIEKTVKPAAIDYARGRVVARLNEVPLESLREAGAANVRWSLLQQAGYKTLADVEGKQPRELAKVHGIGRKSANAVVQAAGQLARRARDESPRLPLAELSDAGAPELAARSLDLLDASDLAGEDPARLEEKVAGYRSTLAELQRETTFTKWLTTPFRRKQAQANIERSNGLTESASATAGSGLVEAARAGREKLKRWKRPKRDASTTARRFRDRYAECCALLENLFTELGLRPRKAVLSGQGGVTEEVARRVEGYSLKAASMRASLRRYQEFGAKYILAQERTILGDEMGLGKTMQALAAMTHRNEDEAGARFFVVAPAGLLINWVREIETFTPLVAHVLHGDDFTSNLELWMRDGGVAITSYATLRNNDLGAMLAKHELTVNLCAVDEAHYIKNPESGRTQAVRRLLDCSHLAVLMSGTPMENHPSEFLYLIDAVRPEDGADLRAQDLELDAAAGSVRAFHAAAAKVYLRRNQEDVLTELPERIEVEEWVELSP
ncbi:MAG: SNF2-related protein, partial [Planctomycetota bacterium]